MSEYQYYEFQTIDKKLTKKEIAELRKYSSRAKISSSKFVNEYNYGDFKGNVEEWMERYFDGFIHFANWGTRRLIFRFTNQTINLELLKQYCLNECAKTWKTDTHTIVEYCIDECECEELLIEGNLSLSKLIPLRMDITLNDYRLFYLGWLLSVQYGNIESNTIEPPLPLGLGSLTPELKSFIKFFDLDRGLLASAALNSSSEIHQISTDDIEPIIAGLSNSSKHYWLSRLAQDSSPNLQAEFRKQIIPECGIQFFSDNPRRKVFDIISGSKD